ncbi:MAG TPA: TonB-dependent receptor [Ignavibacteria bacterium]|nr:TonB-dependent receptor [Ignavibacteria bacterium]
MKRFFIICISLTLFICNYAFSQSKGSITGTVIEEISAKPLEGVSVKLMDAAGTTINGDVTKTDGSFSITDIDFGKYNLEISFIGYKTITRNDVEVANSDVLNLGQIKLLSDSIKTDEILVETDKPNVQFEDDKLVYNVGSNTVAKGETVLDVLKKTPMVSVDEQDNVSIRGNTGVKILIDGKESRSFSNLNQMPAELVEKIEVITNPSAKYQAEGVAGIINIVLKDMDVFGTNGYLNLSGGYKDIYNAGTTLGLKKNKFSAELNLYTGQWYSDGTGFSRRDNLNNQSLKYVTNDYNSSNRSRWYYGAPSMNYTFDKKTFVEFFGDFVISNWTYKYNSNINNTTSQNVSVSQIDQRNNMDGKWKSYNAGIFFNKKFNEDGDHELSIQTSYNKPGNDQNNFITRSSMDGNGNPTSPNPYVYKENRNFNYNNFYASADYILPIDKTNKFEAGYKGSIENEDNDFTNDSLNHATGQYDRNTLISNRFKYDKNIQALYTVFNTSLAGIGIKAGLRMEHADINGDVINTGQKFNNKYTDLFPSATISYKFGMTEEIKASYSRRINRPFSWFLNPFLSQNTPQALYSGNPDLDPEYTNSFELAFMKFFGTFSVTPTAFFRRKTDVISFYSELIDSNTTFSTYRNIGTSDNYGMDLIIGGRPLNWLNLNGTLSYYISKFDENSLPSGAEREGSLWQANLNSFVTLPENFSLQIFYNYQGDNVTVQGKTKGFHNLSAGVSKSFLDNTLTFNLMVRDILKQSSFYAETYASGYTSVNETKNNQRTINFSISYRFGKMEQEQKPQRKNEGSNQQAPPPTN